MDKPTEKIDLARLNIKREDGRIPTPWHTNPRYLVPAGITLIMLLAWFAISGVAHSGSVAGGGTSASLPAAPAPLSITSDSPGAVLNATGYVVAQRKASVSSKATGRIKKLNVVEGDLVKSGAVLAEIENNDLVAMVNEKDAQINSLSAQISSALAEYDETKLELDRSVSLRRQKVISQSEMDKADARFKKALASMEGAKADLALAQAQLERAKVDLQYTYILAPFDGTVLTKNADVGEIVAPFGSSTGARATVVTLADMESLEVEADVSESNITKVFIGQECEITLDSFPGKPYRGVVSKIVPTVDRAKATVMVKIRFVEKDQTVLPEMSSKIAFMGRNPT